MPWAIAAVASSAVNEYAFVPGSLIVTTAILRRSSVFFDNEVPEFGALLKLCAVLWPRYWTETVNV